MTGYWWRAGTTARAGSGILAGGRGAVGLSPFGRTDEQQRQTLALGTVDQEAERVIARRREGQVPQVDGKGERRVAPIALAASDETARRAGDLATIGVQQYEPDLVLSLGLRRRDSQPDHEGEVWMPQGEPPTSDPRDAATQHVEFLAGDGLGRVREEGEVDVGHLAMLAAADPSVKVRTQRLALAAAVARLRDGVAGTAARGR